MICSFITLASQCDLIMSDNNIQTSSQVFETQTKRDGDNAENNPAIGSNVYLIKKN
jgi:hypothetical protein